MSWQRVQFKTYTGPSELGGGAQRIEQAPHLPEALERRETVEDRRQDEGNEK
jgi:hypothetical protein